MITTQRVIELAEVDRNTIISINEHIAFFQDDKETPFSKIIITTARDKTPIVVYIKNISTFLLNNIKLFVPTGIKVLTSGSPKEIKPGEGFFIEFEINTSKSIERFIQVESKPHSVVFE